MSGWKMIISFQFDSNLCGVDFEFAERHDFLLDGALRDKSIDVHIASLAESVRSIIQSNLFIHSFLH